MTTADKALEQSGATEPAVLEIERFEWASPDRIELVGYWTGLRGRRFIRPTLVLEGGRAAKRLLATLDHKPWQADDGEQWMAAFAWDGEPVKFESADLHVGASLDVRLPAPLLRPGKPRRFRHRAVARDAAREAEPEARAVGPGIVTDPPTAKPAARRVDPAPPPPEPADPPEFAEESAPSADAPAPSELQKAHADVERLRVDLDRVRGERDELRRERDKALDQVRSLRAEIEQERQAREQAVADGRAAEREEAARMLAEGAELRAAVERQREMAYAARDEAQAARDKAIEARDKACAERDDAIQARKQAERDRKHAFAERERAHKDRDHAMTARDQALAERAEALAERDAAVKERDEIIRVHERGLPLKPPQPRFRPVGEQPPTPYDVWMPRGVAIGILLIFAVIVLRLFAGA